MPKSLISMFIVVSALLALSGCICGVPGAPVLAIPLDDESGFALVGVLDFSGDLLKPTETNTNWALNWKFTFPTGGYAVEDVEVVVLESFPEQVQVTFGVDTPGPHDIVTQVITEVEGSLDIAVDEGATFDIRIVEKCNLDLTL